MRQLTIAVSATALIAIAIGCVNRAWAREPAYTINIAAAGGRSSIAVGEPLILDVSYLFEKSKPPSRRASGTTSVLGSAPDDVFRREVKIKATLEGKESFPVFHERSTLARRRDDSGRGYVARYEVLYGFVNKRSMLMFDRPGEYRVIVKDDRGLTAEPISVTVTKASEATTKALSILKANKDYLAFMLGGVAKSESALTAMRRIATECKPSPLAMRAAARLGLERYVELRKKYPRTEEWRKLYRQEQAGGPELDEIKSYLTEGMKLPVESKIREQVVATLSKIAWISGNSEKTRSLLRTLADQYPYGRYGKKATRYLADVKAIEAREQAAASAHPPATTRPAVSTRPAVR